MSDKEYNQPYRALGLRLKVIRENLHKSIAEVSGAVEIDQETLVGIERGESRPTEEILMLLLNLFGTHDDEAVKLWELAGYTQGKNDQTSLAEDFSGMKPVAMVVPIDNRVIYTDMVNVSVNNYGVVMNFMQSNGGGNQPTTVARVGMSKDHAKSMMRLLHETIQRNEQVAQQKTLQPPKEDN